MGGENKLFLALNINISKTVGDTSKVTISQISDATTAKRVKIDQNCQRRCCKQLNVLFNIMFLRWFAIDFFVIGPSYTHFCRALTLASA